MVINYHLINLFEMLYINIPNGKKPQIYVNLCQIQKTVTVFMRTVAITNIDVKGWTQKHELPQVNCLY